MADSNIYAATDAEYEIDDRRKQYPKVSSRTDEAGEGQGSECNQCGCRFDQEGDRKIKPPSKQRVFTQQIRRVSRVIVIVESI